MRIALVRMVAAVLQDVTYGVDAQLAAMPADGADQLPAAGGASAIACVADDNLLTHSEGTTSWRLLVSSDDPMELQGEAVMGYRDAESAVVEVAVVRKLGQGSVAAAWRDTNYLLEAVVRAIKSGLLDPARIGTAGVRGRFAIQTCNKITWGPITPPRERGSDLVDGSCRLEFYVRDNAP